MECRQFDNDGGHYDGGHHDGGHHGPDGQRPVH